MLSDAEIESLNKQIAFLKDNNTQALQQLQNLSVISSSQAESIKKSMENIGAKDSYIQDLQASMARKDSLNMALVMNLKGAIGNMDDKDINIKVDKGVVYIDISDKLLFKSGSYNITENAKGVLGKVALVLKNQPDIEFMVEGHTDNIGYSNGVLADNWDLSVKRATSVVRILQKEYGLDHCTILQLPAAANTNRWRITAPQKAGLPTAEPASLFCRSWTSSLNCWKQKSNNASANFFKPLLQRGGFFCHVHSGS